MTVYVATVTKAGGRGWAVELQGAKTGYATARTLAEVESVTRELIARIHAPELIGRDGTPAGWFSLAIQWPDDIATLATPAVSARMEASAAKKKAEDATRTAVRQLKEHGLSVRETATLLHVSPALVGQIVKGVA